MTPDSLTTALKEEARRLGFDLVGVAPAVASPTYAQFGQWLADGCAAGMQHLAARAEARSHPRHVLEGVRSVLMLGTNYRTVEPQTAFGEPPASAGGCPSGRVDAIPGLARLPHPSPLLWTFLSGCSAARDGDLPCFGHGDCRLGRR
jgi:hypothetical protein